MKRWHAVMVAVLLVGLLRLVPQPDVLSGDEVDALTGGFRLADRLTDSDTGLERRLVEGFVTPAGHPRLAGLPDRPWRPPVAEAPLPRWLAALGLMGPDLGEHTNLGSASRGATVAFALALALLLSVWWRDDPALAIVAAVVLLSLPTAAQAAQAAGAGAAGVFAMACWLAAMRVAVRPGGPAWPVGVATALCLAVHPGACVLLVAMYAAWAAERPRMDVAASAEAGEGALPSAPVGLYLAPVITVVGLALLWPSLWSESGARLGSWLMDTFRVAAPDQSVAGVDFAQASARAPQAWTAVLQWGAWCTWPVVAAWGVGVRAAWRDRREGAWTPIIATLALLLVGTLDGGLFNARLSLLSLLWVPTALTAGRGIIALGERLAEWRAWSRRPSIAAAATLTLTLALAGTFAGQPIPSAGPLGAVARAPMPLALLEALDHDAPGATLHVIPQPQRWGDAVTAARDQLGLDVLWAAHREESGWLAIVGDARGVASPPPGAVEVWRGAPWGVSWKAYRLPGETPR